MDRTETALPERLTSSNVREYRPVAPGVAETAESDRLTRRAARKRSVTSFVC